MRTVTHREMRNNSAEILRAVAAGEDILVTNNGEPAALITRPPTTVIDALVAAGEARSPTKSLRTLKAPKTVSSVSTKEILDDLRGER